MISPPYIPDTSPLAGVQDAGDTAAGEVLTALVESNRQDNLGVWRVAVLYDALRALVIEDANRCLRNGAPMSEILRDAVDVVDAVERSLNGGGE